MRVILVGEGMLELSQSCDGKGWQLGYGGDTLNTALHLARYGRDVAYASAIGNDAFSAQLCERWAAEGLDTSLVLRDATRSTGLYAISTDGHGERSFSYWRSDSAARRLFEHADSFRMIDSAAQADLLCFSLISLAILPTSGREALLRLARRVRDNGGRVVFDGNYRPRLWASLDETRAAHEAALGCCDIGLPTLDDEQQLFGHVNADAVAQHWQARGVHEVIVKLGERGCRIADGRIVPPPAVITPTDTSGAGDAFNAGYLHARLAGEAPAQAALIAHRLAGWVVTQRGAIPPRTAQAPY